ncbi:MAG: HEAT repeat domain-containing protein [Chthoniobacterales bacterium]
MKTKSSIPFAILAAGLLPAVGFADDYEPFVVKTPPTSKVIVLDISKEKRSMEDALPAISCIQGLVNRTSDVKIFVKDVPFRCYFDVSEDHPRNASRVGPGNPFEYMLEELIPVPQEVAELDESKESPALDYLLKNYADLVKGTVPFNGPWEADGPLATNTAIFEDGILVSDRVNEMIRGWGYDFPVLADYGEIETWAEGNKIAFDKYFDHPERNDRTVGFGITPAMLDYCMATRTFCTYFDKRRFKGAEREEAHDELVELLEHYPDGVPLVGYIEITGAHHAAKDAGLQPVCGELPNASVTSSLPTDPSKFHAEKPGQALEIDPDGVYITWYGVDIDAIDFSLLVYKSLRNDPKAGQAPLFIKMTPFFIDWFPTYFEWLSKLDPDQVDFFYSPYGDGPPSEATRNAAAHYVANSNGAFGSHNVAPETNLPVFELTGGYTGDVGDYTTKWSVSDGTVWASKLGGMRLGPKNPHPYDPDVDVMVENIKQSILRHAEPGKPYFILGRLPTECGIDVFSMIVEAQNRLKADPEIHRNLHFVRPFDAAATFAKYEESGMKKAKPEPFTGDAIATLSSEDRSERETAARHLVENEPDDSNVPALVAAFDNESDETTRRLLALAIGEIGAPAVDAIPGLASALGNDTVGPAAAWALSQIGQPALEPLVEALRSDEPSTVVNAAHGIEWLGQDAAPAEESVREVLVASDDVDTQVALVNALGGIGGQAAVDLLVESLSGQQPAVARAAMKALGRNGSEKAVNALIPILSTGDPLDSFDAAAAASALGEMGPIAKPAIPELMKLINEPKTDRYLIGQAAIALGKLQAEEALPRMVELIADGRILLASDVTLAVEPFGQSAEPAVSNIVEHVLGHGWPEPNLRAVNTLAAIGPAAEVALPTLRKIAEDNRDPAVREAAEEAINAIGAGA